MPPSLLPPISNSDRPASWAVSIDGKGLVCGAGSVLARMTGGPTLSKRPALDADRDRLLAMLSVVAGAPLPADKVLPHLEAASAHWQRGDKALANLRLVFAKLPRPGDPAAVERLMLTERLLDDGLAPDSLMKALWPQPAGDALHRYNRAQPRVPAGHGVESGRWEFETGQTAERHADHGRRIVVAVNTTGTKPSEQQQAEFVVHDWMGNLSVEERSERNLPLVSLDELPGGPAASAKVEAEIAAATKSAVEAIGMGRGAVRGTRIHTELKNRLDALGREDIHGEQSYLDGKRVDYGTKGSIRVDAIHGDPDRPVSIYDLKTGLSRLTAARVQQFIMHLPRSFRGLIKEVRP